MPPPHSCFSNSILEWLNVIFNQLKLTTLSNPNWRKLSWVRKDQSWNTITIVMEGRMMLTMLAKDSQFHMLSSPRPVRGGALRLSSVRCAQNQCHNKDIFSLHQIKQYFLQIVAEFFSPGNFVGKCAFNTFLLVYEFDAALIKYFLTFIWVWCRMSGFPSSSGWRQARRDWLHHQTNTPSQITRNIKKHKELDWICLSCIAYWKLQVFKIKREYGDLRKKCL